MYYKALRSKRWLNIIPESSGIYRIEGTSMLQYAGAHKALNLNLGEKIHYSNHPRVENRNNLRKSS
jgi:hypothetical protein